MAIDIEAARADGYTDAQIADALAASRGFDIETARKDKVPDQEIIDHLAKRPPSSRVSRDESLAASVSVDTETDEPGSVLSRIGSAAVEGFQNTPPILTPAAREAVEKGGEMGRLLTNPLFDLGSTILKGAGAAGGAISQGAMELGKGLGGGESLGRFFNMFGQVAIPEFAGGVPGLATTALRERPPGMPPPGRFAQEHFGEGLRENPLAAEPQGPAPSMMPPGAARPAPEPLQEAPPPPPAPPPPSQFVPPRPQEYRPGEMDQPGPPSPNAFAPADSEPGSLGAAGTPGAAARMTPEETRANLWNAEQKAVHETQQPGFRDDNVYVKGNLPTEVEAEQTVHAARELKALKNIDTEVSQEARELADAKHANREVHYGNVAGSVFDKQKAQADADTRIDQSMARVLNTSLETDTQSVLDLADDILRGPDGKISPVERVVKNIRERLFDNSGNLETEPRMLWGVRRQINFLLSKEGQLETPGNRAAVRQLMQMRDAIDDAIEPAAPGFGAALAQYAQDMKAVDRMDLLQGRESKLLDSQNRMSYLKVHQMVKEGVAARHPDAPHNPWKSLTPEEFQQLIALDKDLRRSASADDLAKAQGSDTIPNAFDVVKRWGSVGANAVPILGPIVNRVREARAPGLARKAKAEQVRRGMEMLYPQNALAPGEIPEIVVRPPRP